jgi:hypothetical protein
MKRLNQKFSIYNLALILRTIVISIFNKISPVHMTAVLDGFFDNFQLLIRNLKIIKIL